MLNLHFQLLYFLLLFLVLHHQICYHWLEFFVLLMKLVQHLHVQPLEPVFDQIPKFLNRWGFRNARYWQWLWFRLLIQWRLLGWNVIRCHRFRNWVLAGLRRNIWCRWRTFTRRFRVISVSTWRCNCWIAFSEIWLLFCSLQCFLTSWW